VSCCAYALLLTWAAQRAPDCDMVLVHDDDLARVDGICDTNVCRHWYLSSIIPVISTVTGNPPTGCSEESPPKV
jgi:hypothetical protein